MQGIIMSNSRLFKPAVDNVKYISLFSIDADGCLYNSNYIKLLMHIINKYFSVFNYLNSKDMLDENDELIIKNIINEIQNIDLTSLDWQKLENELFELVRLQAVNNLRMIQDETLAKFMENFHVNKTQIQTLSHEDQKKINNIITVNVNSLVNIYLDMMQRIDEDIYIAILYRTNIDITKYIIKTICSTKVSTAFNINFSSRQDRDLDLRGQIENRTGLIYEDMFSMGSLIKSQLEGLVNLEKPFRTSSFSMADIHAGLPSGRTYDLMTTPNVTNHPEHIYDHTKGTIIYAQAHGQALQAMRTHKNAKIDIYAFDNLLEILDGNKELNNHGLYSFYSKYPFLLPKNVTLHLIAYNGEIGQTFTVFGEGEVDELYQKNIKLMVEMCREKSVSKMNIDMANQLDVNEFLQRKLGIRLQVPEDMDIDKPDMDNQPVIHVSPYFNN